MSGKPPHGTLQTTSDYLPSYLSQETPSLSDYGLYLYLTFEDECGEEWWPLEDGPELPNRGDSWHGASRRRFRRTGR
jgi:hypothetical protein